MTWTALPAVAATVTVALVALATLRIEGGSRRGLGMAGFLLVFGAAEFAAALAHLTPADQAPPATAMRWSYILGVMAYLPMIEFLGDLARRSGAERPLGVPLNFSEAFLRMVCAALLLLLAGGDLAYAGVIASPTGHGWVRQWGPLWPALGVVGTLYVSWAVACWNGERRRRGHIDADLGAWLAAIMLLTCGPILTSTILPATGLAHTNNLNGLSTVLGGLATVTGLVLSRRLQLERITPAEDLDPTQDDVGDADGDPLAPVVLACTGCKAQYMRLPADAMCSQDGRPVKTGQDPMVGAVVADKWRILRFLGAGGMARVYAAEHRHLHTRCAIKVIWGDLLGDERALERFSHRDGSSKGLVVVLGFPGPPLSLDHERLVLDPAGQGDHWARLGRQRRRVDDRLEDTAYLPPRKGAAIPLGGRIVAPTHQRQNLSGLRAHREQTSL